MGLSLKPSSDDDSLVGVLNFEPFWAPFAASVEGRDHAGEELQDPQAFARGEPVLRYGNTLRFVGKKASSTGSAG
jgi:hypothetical protein